MKIIQIAQEAMQNELKLFFFFFAAACFLFMAAMESFFFKGNRKSWTHKM